MNIRIQNSKERLGLVALVMLCALLVAGYVSAADLVITNARLFSGTDAGVLEGREHCRNRRSH